MARHRARKGLLATMAALSAAALLSAAPASAECVYAEASYKQPTQTRQYIVGPKRCVQSTPFRAGPDVWVTPGEASILLVDVHVWTVDP